MIKYPQLDLLFYQNCSQENSNHTYFNFQLDLLLATQGYMDMRKKAEMCFQTIVFLQVVYFLKFFYQIVCLDE